MAEGSVSSPETAKAAAPHTSPATGPRAFAALTVGSVGVVYGDIGTSPLYAFRESLRHLGQGSHFSPFEVIGVVSLILWALTITVTLKYVIFLVRADNRGEGGILSLMALAQSGLGRSSRVVLLLGILGASLFSGDAIITPAISVMSAVEGLKLVTPVFTPYVTAIALLILALLFMSQRFGSGRMAIFFGPIMVVWFSLLGLLGLLHAGDDIRIWNALNPVFAVRFLIEHGVIAFFVTGSVFLAVTGAETLYADLGHFGRKPLQTAWFLLVYPCLMLNYLGQGALVLAHPEAIENPFFLMAPGWALLPLVLMTTLATVIASQAVITGAFSLARQAIQLGLLPRMEVQHTSASQEGQIYLPQVNRLLLIGVFALVIIFRSTESLASAYGVAVSATMLVTTLLMFVVAWKCWRWPLWIVAPLICGFLVVDATFLISNLAKLLDGGFIPLLLGAAMMILAVTWVRGAALLSEKTHRDSIPLADLIRMLEKSQPHRVPGTAIFLTADPSVAPSALMHNLKHNQVLHERVIVMSVSTEDMPRVPDAERTSVQELANGFISIKLRYGFMESPRIPAALAMLRKDGLKLDIMKTSFFLGRRSLKPSASSDMPAWQDKLFVALSRQATPATDFFSIPSDRVVELGAQVTI